MTTEELERITTPIIQAFFPYATRRGFYPERTSTYYYDLLANDLTAITGATAQIYFVLAKTAIGFRLDINGYRPVPDETLPLEQINVNVDVLSASGEDYEPHEFVQTHLTGWLSMLRAKFLPLAKPREFPTDVDAQTAQDLVKALVRW